MKTNRSVLYWLLAVSLIVLFAISGCGKKLPPLPLEKKGKAIAAPFDLKYIHKGKTISLSWKHKIDRETAYVKPDGFDIFMAQKTFDACEGCPFVFEKAGFVSMPAKTYTAEIEKGFQYYFRIQAVGENNMTSEYSQTIQFEYK